MPTLHPGIAVLRPAGASPHILGECVKTLVKVDVLWCQTQKDWVGEGNLFAVRLAR